MVTLAEVTRLVESIEDPEIPVVTIADLGILRAVSVDDDGGYCVEITPTYSGCPALDAIEQSILEALQQQGVKARVKRVLQPAWTTDWMTEAGREKLLQYGIVPPERVAGDASLKISTVAELKNDMHQKLACPRCSSENTELVSEFGSTACKSQWRCRVCLEPFEQFKCH